MSSDAWAAAQEAINESGLAAEVVYDLLTHAPAEEAIQCLRLLLKESTALRIAYESMRRIADERRDALAVAREDKTNEMDI
jgi:hypothetical protein